jgi:hypothetical protein
MSLVPSERPVVEQLVGLGCINLGLRNQVLDS